MRLRQRERQLQTHINHVVAVLDLEFEWDDITRNVCRRTLNDTFAVRGSLGIPSWFEFICDHPASALWRLKANPDAGRWGVRMSFYGMSDKAEAHAAELTNRLNWYAQ